MKPTNVFIFGYSDEECGDLMTMHSNDVKICQHPDGHWYVSIENKAALGAIKEVLGMLDVAVEKAKKRRGRRE